MASCTESGTLSLLTMGENIIIEEPTQASKGKSDSSPIISESFSPLSEGTSLTPLRDFPLADLSGESGRQLAESDFEQHQISNQNELTDSVKD